MINASVLRSKQAFVLQILLILSWLDTLTASYSYFFTYGLLAVAGVLCAWDNMHNPVQLSGWRLAGAAGVAAVFSLTAVLANYDLFEPVTALFSLFNLALCLLGGFSIGMNCLLCMHRRLPVTLRCASDDRKHPGRFFLMSFLSVVVIDMLFLIFESFPGRLTADSISQMTQIHNGSYTNWHPYWHTRVVEFFTDISLALTGGYQIGVAMFSVFQILAVAACFSYTLVTLYQRRFPKGCIGAVWAMYALLPYHIAYSSTMWKDIPFAAACLLLITSLYRILSGMKSEKLDMALFALAGLLVCIWRSNGLPAFAVLLVVMLLFFRKRKKLLAIMGVVLVCGYLMTGPVLAALGVAKTNYVEALSIPLQQVARVVYEGRELTPQQRELIETVGTEEEIREAYDQGLSDPIKNMLRASEAEELLLEDPQPYFRLWLDLFLRYPGDYVKAWIDQTKGYWNGGYAEWIFSSGVHENSLGIEAASGNNIIGKLFRSYCRYFEMIPVFKPFISIGLHTWLVISCCLVNILHGRKEWVLSLPILAILLSLVISTPVYSEFRYIYSMFLAVPLLLAVTCVRVPEEA